MIKAVLSMAFAGITLYLGAQVNFSSRQGSFNLETTNMPTQTVQALDGVATLIYDNDAGLINGSPYLEDEFVEGVMTVQDGTEIPGLRYRYDIYGDRVQFIVGTDTALINKPLSLKSLVIGEREFVYEVYMLDAGRVATGYFELVGRNEYMTILLRRTIELEQDIYVANYGGGGGTKEFKMEENDSYFVKHKNSAAIEINNKKGFLRLVPEVYQEDIKQYMKENRLSVRKVEDLQAISEYYSSLQNAGS